MKLTDTRTGQVCRDATSTRRIVILHGGVIYQRDHVGAPVTPTTLTRVPHGARRSEQRYGLLVADNVTETDAQALASDPTYRDRLIHDMRTTGQAHTDDYAPITLITPTLLAGPWSQRAYNNARRRANRPSYEQRNPTNGLAALAGREQRMRERNLHLDALRARLEASSYDKGRYKRAEWSLTEPRVTIEYATLTALLDAANAPAHPRSAR